MSYSREEVAAITDDNYKAILGLADHCHHYTSLSEVPWDIQKYWQQRYDIWTKYDDGIMMTDDAWFGVTPEPVAMHVAEDIMDWLDRNDGTAANGSPKTIVDIFAGAGGNAIAFALSGQWDIIIAVEKNPDVIACAKNNAYIYGVLDKITWVNDDCFKYISTHSAASKTDDWELPLEDKLFLDAFIFASPPWGGVSYRDEKVFNLDDMQPYSAQQIHDLVWRHDCALFLPRTSDMRQLANLIPKDSERKIECVQYCMDGASKALVAYVPCAEEDRGLLCG